MASKRQRGASSSSPQAYDRRRFVSVEAATRFDTYLAGKALTPERGLLPDEILDGEMARQIIEKGWDSFTNEPEPAVIAIVKEFYANAEDKSPYEAIVRGKKVSFSGHTINEFYNLRPPEFCQYAQFVSQHPNLEQIVTELCKPGSTWSSKGPRGAMTFPSQDLSLYGKIWYAFICAKLLPSQHVSDVTQEKAVLLYAIVKGFRINVGNVIEESIRRNLKETTKGGLPHPSLICGLCRQAGVRWGDDEVVQQPMRVLDHNLIKRYQVWKGGDSHPQGLGFIIRPPSPQPEDGAAADPGGSAHASSSSDGLTTRHFNKIMRRLYDCLEDQHQEVVSQNRCLAKRQETIHAYTYTCSSALANAFSQMNPGASPIQIPPPPPLSVFPPPVSESDEEDSLHNDAVLDSDD